MGGAPRWIARTPFRAYRDAGVSGVIALGAGHGAAVGVALIVVVMVTR